MKHSMTVSELIEQLQYLEHDGKGDLEVKFAYNYGDYWRTQVAEGVKEVTEGVVTYSDYHSMDKVVDEDDRRPGMASRAAIILG